MIVFYMKTKYVIIDVIKYWVIYKIMFQVKTFRRSPLVKMIAKQMIYVRI